MKQETQNPFDLLPNAIIGNIVERIPLVSVGLFARSSKTLYDIVNDAATLESFSLTRQFFLQLAEIYSANINAITPDNTNPLMGPESKEKLLSLINAKKFLPKLPLKLSKQEAATKKEDSNPPVPYLVVTYSEKTPLYGICEQFSLGIIVYQDAKEIVEALAKKDLGDVQATIHLLAAAFNVPGSPELLEIILKHSQDFDLNRRNVIGQTPLMSLVTGFDEVCVDEKQLLAITSQAHEQIISTLQILLKFGSDISLEFEFEDRIGSIKEMMPDFTNPDDLSGPEWLEREYRSLNPVLKDQMNNFTPR